jgi:hypothetical protein
VVAQGAPNLPGGPGTAGTGQVTDTNVPQLPGKSTSQTGAEQASVPGAEQGANQGMDQPMMQQGPPTNPGIDQSSTKPRQMPGGGAPPPGLGGPGMGTPGMLPGTGDQMGNPMGMGQFDPTINGGPQQVGADAGVPNTAETQDTQGSPDATGPNAPRSAVRAARITAIASDINDHNPGIALVVATRVAERVVDEFLVKEADWPDNPLAYQSWTDVPHGPWLRRLGPRAPEDPEEEPAQQPAAQQPAAQHPVRQQPAQQPATQQHQYPSSGSQWTPEQQATIQYNNDRTRAWEKEQGRARWPWQKKPSPESKPEWIEPPSQSGPRPGQGKPNVRVVDLSQNPLTPSQVNKPRPPGQGEPRRPGQYKTPGARVPDRPKTPPEDYDPKRDDPEWYHQFGEYHSQADQAEESESVDLSKPIGTWLNREHGDDVARNHWRVGKR